MKKKLLSLMLLLSALIVGSGSAWGQSYESLYSATFTDVDTHSYTQNKTFTLNNKSWTASVSQVNGGVFYLGCNSNNASKGILNNNSTFSAVVTALKNVDATYNSNYTTAHAYALLFDNSYSDVTKVSFDWAGGNNAFQVYLFGDSGSGYVLLNSTNYSSSGQAISGSVEWTGSATNFTKFAIVARPGATNTTATNKTLRAANFNIYKTSGGNKTQTSTVVNAPVGFVTDLNGNTGVLAGTLTATVTPEGASALASPTIAWSSDNTSVATVNASTGAVTLWAVGSANIKATYAGDDDYDGSDGSYALTVTNSNPGDGSLSKPYTVAEALALISGYSNGGSSASSVYTKGIVSSIGSLSSGSLTYFISIDGTSSNTIQVYKGKNIGNTDFSSTSDISVNDEVIIYGQLYKYVKNSTTTPEINTPNYIYSINGKIKPTITFGAASYEVAYNGSLTISATSSPSGTITYSSSDTDIAEINASTGVVTPKTEGEVTIRATLAEGADNVEWYEEVTLTVTDGRETAGIEFANATVTKTWGESFSGQELTNPNGLTVSYESTVPGVATVNASTGEVTIVKAGTTVIKATFEGNSSYMPAEVSYTLTVNKAAAGLSFDETAFDIDLNDDSFVAPTLNNPNSLTVTWASDDTDIATVNASTGALTLVTTAEGSVTITASSEATDNYNAGEASYTITITDPNKKGTKRNPYTVAEVEGQTNATDFGNNIYVTGYIVGSVANNKCYKTTTASLVNTNLLIADTRDKSFTEGAAIGSNEDGLIPVELPNTGTIRADWGVSTNNSLIGYKIIFKGNAQAYFGTNGIKGTSEITAVSVPVTVTSAGYATFACDFSLDFTGVDGITANTASVNGSTVTLTPVTKVPAGAGIVLTGTEGTYNIPVTTETVNALSNNELVGVTEETTVEATADDKTNYILSNEASGVGFYKASGAKLRANHAYLSTTGNSGSGSVKEFLGFAETDGIATVSTATENEGTWYNLAGQRIARPTHGLYIVNGRKVLVK